MLRLCCFFLAFLGAVVIASFLPSARGESPTPQVDALLKMHADGNHKDAYEGLRLLVLNKNTRSADLPRAFEAAIECLEQLNRVDEIDEFREKAVAAHGSEWQLLAAVAKSYINVPHYGYTIGGEFHRGQHRGGGKVVQATDRDRVHALQLYRQALPLAKANDDKHAAAQMLRDFAQAIASSQPWRLQLLTDLDQLPDYEEGWGYGGQPQGAPVDAE